MTSSPLWAPKRRIQQLPVKNHQLPVKRYHPCYGGKVVEGQPLIANCGFKALQRSDGGEGWATLKSYRPPFPNNWESCFWKGEGSKQAVSAAMPSESSCLSGACCWADRDGLAWEVGGGRSINTLQMAFDDSGARRTAAAAGPPPCWTSRGSERLHCETYTRFLHPWLWGFTSEQPACDGSSAAFGSNVWQDSRQVHTPTHTCTQQDVVDSFVIPMTDEELKCSCRYWHLWGTHEQGFK